MPLVDAPTWKCPYCGETMHVAFRNRHIVGTCAEIAKVFHVEDEFRWR